jgi:hypothetical protein
LSNGVGQEIFMTQSTSPSLVQIRCSSLRSKSSYGAFGNFHEDILELVGSTATYWCLQAAHRVR